MTRFETMQRRGQRPRLIYISIVGVLGFSLLLRATSLWLTGGSTSIYSWGFGVGLTLWSLVSFMDFRNTCRAIEYSGKRVADLEAELSAGLGDADGKA